MTAEAVFEAQRVFGQAFADMDVPKIEQFFFFPTSYFPRSFVGICGFQIYHDVRKNQRNREIFKRLVQVAAEHGWGEYRTQLSWTPSRTFILITVTRYVGFMKQSRTP